MDDCTVHTVRPGDIAIAVVYVLFVVSAVVSACLTGVFY